MFDYTKNNNKRYHSLDYYYKNKYHSKVFKVSLNQNLTCPNIDGKKGYNGCIYCKNGSGSYRNIPIKEQFEFVKNIELKKWPNAKYIAYFQANSNTYGDFKYITNNFMEVLTYKDVVGINIATRCDCIDDNMLDFLEDLNKKTDLTIELGLQSMHNKTLEKINCKYTLEDFLDTYNKLKKRNIKVVVHIINGLLEETKSMMIETAKFLNKIKVDGVKIHMLHILKGTKLYEIYQNNPFHVLEKDEYIDIVCTQLEYLDENIVIHRITGDPTIDDLIAPFWLTKKFIVLNDIDKELKRRNSSQGKKKEI